MPDINKEYAYLFQKYAHAWADAFTKVQGRGWILLPTHPKNMEERNRVYVDFVKKGYAVYTEERYGDYYIYVLKLPETGGRVSERYVSESRAKPKPKEWQDLVDSLRITYVFNFKLVIEDVRRRFPSVPEKDIVDYIIGKYIGKARLRKAVYKPENRLVNVWTISHTPNFLVEGFGIRNYADLSFDPVKISTLEKTGMHRLEAADGIKIREILMNYKAGLFDTMDAYQYIKDVVERM